MPHDADQIRYASGAEVRIGDRVDFDGENATVVELLITPEQVAANGLGEPVVVFNTPSLGEVCQSPADGGWDGVVLLERGA